MYKNVQRISREAYAEMLKAGVTFKNWSLYEPQHNPSKVYYIVELGNNLTINKTER